MEIIGGNMFLRNVGWHSTRRHIPEDDTLHNHPFEILKSYIIPETVLHKYRMI
jgi:hypothetical protein